MQYDITCLIEEGCLSHEPAVEEDTQEYSIAIVRVHGRLHFSSTCMAIGKTHNSFKAIVDPKKHTQMPCIFHPE